MHLFGRYQEKECFLLTISTVYSETFVFSIKI